MEKITIIRAIDNNELYSELYNTSLMDPALIKMLPDPMIVRWNHKLGLYIY